MQATTLNVSGMTCNHCVMAVTKALSEVAGVEAADVSLEKAQAVVKGQRRCAGPHQRGQGRRLRGRAAGLIGTPAYAQPSFSARSRKSSASTSARYGVSS